MQARRCTLSLARYTALAAHLLIIVFVNLYCDQARSAAAADHRRRIYFLESLAPTQPAAVKTIEAFQKRLAEKTTESFDVFIDYMDLERFPAQAHIPNTARYLAEKYAAAPPDLLIPLGRAAIPFMLQYRDAIAPDVPLIMANVPSRALADGSALTNSIWVAAEYNFGRTFELAQRLQPDAHKLAIIGGASEYDRSWVEDARRELAPYLEGYEVSYLVGLPYDEMLRRVSQLSPDTIVIMSFVFVDGDGLSRVPPDVAVAIAKVSTAPVYSPVSSFFGRGIVGGYMDSFEAHGVAAADAAFEILSGTAVAKLDHQIEPLHQYKVDARQLEHWGLSAKLLPRAAIVSFQQPTIWQDHPNVVLAAVAIFVLQTALAAFLLVQRHRRMRAEAEAAERRLEVMHLTRVMVLGELSGAIAHEVNQPLTAILSNAQAALELLREKSPKLAEIREAISDIVDEDNRAGEVIERLRTLLRKGERKVEQIDLNDLVRSTIALLHSELISRRIEVKSDLSSSLPTTWGDPVQLQQVLLNLLMNAMDAMASTPESHRQITIRSRLTQPNLLEVRIRDRGTGIGGNTADPFKPFYTSKTHGLGLGLSICSTIAQAHGGKLTLANHENSGAVAVLSLPVTELLAVAAK
jgi:signal transduction histidine kinase